MLESHHKLGRKPRAFNPKIMHLSSVFAASDLPPPPETVDWTNGITEWGQMLNNTLGDCTCAAAFHARQVWSATTYQEDTQPDAEVLKLYEQACGYNPDDSSTDRGGVEQDVLSFLLNKGYPLASASDRIMAFFEVDPRNANDIKTVINECGVCYIGFEVPENIDEEPGSVWKVDESASIEGGHAVVLVGYDEDTVTLISWGALYKMTWDFFQKYTDEAYAIIDPTWVASGKTTLGLTSAELSAMMEAVRQ